MKASKYIITSLHLLIFLVWHGIPSHGQDTQFSQFYNAPLYFNPALTGDAMDTRAGMNYRNAWSGIEQPFTAYSFFADHFIADYNVGVGLLADHHQEGTGGLSLTQVKLSVAYQVTLSNNWTARPALQIGVSQRSVNFGGFTFRDQLDDQGNLNSGTMETPNDESVFYPDINTGILFYNNRLWLGFTAKHINRPIISFYDDNIFLNEFVNIHAGYNIPLEITKGGSSVDRIMPVINYKLQDTFDQLDIGGYIFKEPFMGAIIYRGVPIRQNTSYPAISSLILMGGIHYEGLQLGYSYDFMLSGLTQSKGIHEISLIFEFALFDIGNRKYDFKQLPCPRF